MAEKIQLQVLYTVGSWHVGKSLVSDTGYIVVCWTEVESELLEYWKNRNQIKVWDNLEEAKNHCTRLCALDY